MKLNKKQSDLLERRKMVVLATSDLQAMPSAIFVEVNYAKDNEIIITDNEMKRTKNNLLKNSYVSVLAFEEDFSYGLKIFGEANYYTEGKYFDFIKNIESNKGYSPRGVIVITIKGVIEFN